MVTALADCPSTVHMCDGYENKERNFRKLSLSLQTRYNLPYANLNRGPLSLVSTTEELLEGYSSSRRDPSRYREIHFACVLVKYFA
jgi:hypothetical protein